MKRTAIKSRTKLLRRTRIAQVGARAKREKFALDRFRKLVETNAGGNCQARIPERCVYTWPPHMRGQPKHAHHIQPRARGGTHDPENGLWVCALCHGWIHDNPKEARERGWTR